MGLSDPSTGSSNTRASLPSASCDSREFFGQPVTIRTSISWRWRASKHLAAARDSGEPIGKSPGFGPESVAGNDGFFSAFFTVLALLTVQRCCFSRRCFPFMGNVHPAPQTTIGEFAPSADMPAGIVLAWPWNRRDDRQPLAATLPVRRLKSCRSPGFRRADRKVAGVWSGICRG